MTVPSLTWKVDAAVPAVALVGAIDESTDLSALGRALPAGKVRFDFGAVERINSMGVKHWLDFVGQLGGRGSTIVAERCSPAIVSQLNMVLGFLGRGEVRSVLAPYLCEDCDQTGERLFELSTVTPADLKVGPSCPQCGSTMEFDELP